MSAKYQYYIVLYHSRSIRVSILIGRDLYGKKIDMRTQACISNDAKITFALTSGTSPSDSGSALIS